MADEQTHKLTLAQGLDLLAKLRDRVLNPADEAQAFIKFCLENVG